MLAEQDAVSLTLLRQGGSVAASLTDFKLVAKLASREVSEDLLRDLKCDTLQVIDACADAAHDGTQRAAAAARVCALGSRIFAAMLPGPIGSFLQTSRPRTVSLQLGADMAWIPWELAFDGESFLGEKFRLCRQIVGGDQVAHLQPSRPLRPALHVLVLAGEASAATGEGVAGQLTAQLRLVEDVSVTGANVLDLRRDALFGFIGESDVVHYVGSVDGSFGQGGSASWWRAAELVDARSIASLPNPPRLLISQDVPPKRVRAQPSANQAFAADACERGLSVLICGQTRESDECLDFLLAFYRHLASGAAPSESARVGRSALHQHAGIARVACLQAELYGGGDAIVVKDRNSPGKDNRRQVTIMSFDLVGSTRLLEALHAEQYSELLVEYHERCARIVTGYGGTPDDPQGNDGIMCYFGFPVAREDAASQALRASFELIDAVRALGIDVRIGIATGEVVIRNGQPFGPAIHFAARMQSIAAPGMVVVGDSTRRIVRERYRFRELKPEELQPLKGFDRHESLFQALGPARPDRQDASESDSPAPHLTPFVGRGRELFTLEGHWEAVQSGELRLVRMIGEAGIGKSRLVHEFKRDLQEGGHEVIECRCAPEHVNSAFHPVTDWLRRQLKSFDGDAADALLARIDDFVAPAGVDAAAALIADLLSVPAKQDHPVLSHSPERRRQLTLDVLVALSRQRLHGAAACLIVEDVHWIDPSTEEFLNRLALDVRALPLLMLVTARSDAEAGWHPRCVVHEMELRGLSPEASRMLVLSVSGDSRLPSEVVHLLAARADGVPLFIEESTRMVVELHADQSADSMSAATLAVPATILDLLTARLDRLGNAKQVAQIGGTIGREFPLALLRAVLAHEGSPFQTHDLSAHLATLIRSGMLIGHGEGDDVRYLFKHALMRDAAYRSLLERDRIRLHRVIASVISEQFRGLAEHQPELLAFHFTEAGVHAEALKFWEAAARKAVSRSAHVEAINHATNALADLARLPRDTGRDRVELRLHLLLAAQLIATEGYGADRVEREYARAMELAKSLGDEAALLKVMLGLEGFHFMRADFTKARTIADSVGSKAQASADPILRVQSKWALANLLMHQGQMEAAVRLMDDCRSEYDRIEHRPGAVQDPGVMCLCYSAWGLWQLGYPDQALTRVLAVVGLAERLKHNFSVGEAYGFRASVQHFRGENAAALQSAERAIEVCEDGGFVVWLAHARLMRGRIVAELGDPASGIEEMREAYDLWAGTGAVVTTPFYLALRAEGLALGGRPHEGLELLEHALGIVNRGGERYYESEVRRLIGQLILQSAASEGRDRAAEAEAWLRDALTRAQSRKLRSLALRCAMSLSGLWRSQGRYLEAIELLEPVYQSIEEGTGTRDLTGARELLGVIRQELATQ